MSLIRTIKRSISRSGQTAQERYNMAVSAVSYRRKYHGELMAQPDPKKFRAMNAVSRKWAKHQEEKAEIKAARAKYAAEQAAKAKAKKPNLLDRIKKAISKRKQAAT